MTGAVVDRTNYDENTEIGIISIALILFVIHARERREEGAGGPGPPGIKTDKWGGKN